MVPDRCAADVFFCGANGPTVRKTDGKLTIGGPKKQRRMQMRAREPQRICEYPRECYAGVWPVQHRALPGCVWWYQACREPLGSPCLSGSAGKRAAWVLTVTMVIG